MIRLLMLALFLSTGAVVFADLQDFQKAVDDTKNVPTPTPNPGQKPSDQGSGSSGGFFSDLVGSLF